MQSVFIYVLKDPDTGQIRYVGASGNPRKRLRDHLRDKEINHRTNWVASLKSGSMFPILTIIDEVSEVEWQQWEVAYIEYFRERGCALVNRTPGGDSGPVLRGDKSPNFGKKHSPERRLALSLLKSGKAPSLITRLACIASMTGRKFSPEWRQKIAGGLRGRKLSAEHRLKLSVSHSGKKHSTEHRKNNAEARLGKELSVETRLRMSASQRLRRMSEKTSG